MIRIDKALSLQVSNDKEKDLINEKEFVSFEEVYSYDLPTGVLKVRISHEKVRHFVPTKEGELKFLTVMVGRGGEIEDYLHGVVVKYTISRLSDEVLLNIFLIGLPSLLSRKIKAYRGKSVEAVVDSLNLCGVKSEVSCICNYSDLMVWIQSESTKRFIHKVWKHSYSEEGFLLVGYMGDYAVVTDNKGLVNKKKEPWKFTGRDFESGYIKVNIEPFERSVLPFYASEVKSVSLDEAEVFMDKVDYRLLFGDEKYSIFDRRVDYFHCENVFDKYWFAMERNKAYFSNKFRVGVIVLDEEWQRFELFDLVYLSVGDDELSGFYWIEKIERVFSLGSQVNVRVVLCREAM